jgi:hypothetical protein
MKRATLFASAALAVMGRIALAQGGDDPMAQLRACSLMERADRLECLDRLSRAITPATPPAPKEDRWIISQTRSPVDYSPIATATISSREVAGGGAMQLSIRCRGGRTEIAISGPAVSGRGDDYAISYRVNGDQSAQIGAAAVAFGAGVAFKADAVALIQSLPGDGEFAVHLSPHVGASQDAIFSLAGLETVRAKIAASCKWPHAIAKNPTTDDR